MIIPEDVQEIIQYTKLRKKLVKQDQKLRQQFSIPQNSITFQQMRLLHEHLK